MTGPYGPYNDPEHQFEIDFAHLGQSSLDNPESPIQDKTGCIDMADTGYVASCGGFMGNEQLIQFHYVYDVSEARQWLTEHGCTLIVDITESK